MPNNDDNNNKTLMTLLDALLNLIQSVVPRIYTTCTSLPNIKAIEILIYMQILFFLC